MNDDSTGKPEMTVNVAPQVVFRHIDDEMVLINLNTERMFTLNSSGARFWQLLSEENSLDEISRQMQLEYEVTAAEVEQDISDLLDLLSDGGLIDIE